MNPPDKSAKRGLGRGLGALIVNTDDSANPATQEVIAQAEAGGVRLLSTDRITANPHQPRTYFDDELLAELALSIREHGIIQPLIVTAARDLPGHYWIIAGERRWRVAQLAELAGGARHHPGSLAAAANGVGAGGKRPTGGSQPAGRSYGLRHADGRVSAHAGRSRRASGQESLGHRQYRAPAPLTGKSPGGSHQAAHSRPAMPAPFLPSTRRNRWRKPPTSFKSVG